MTWRMRIGHYKPEMEVRIVNGRIDPPTFVTEEFREHYGYPSLTDEDLFCLVFFDFSHSIKVALLDEAPLTLQQVHARGEIVYERAHEERRRRIRTKGKRRIMINSYVEECENLYQQWLQCRELVPAGFGFQQDYAPEPYLLFDGASIDDIDGEKPNVVFLTTNPGKGEPFQMSEPCGVAKEEPYICFQQRLVDCYYTSSGSIGAAALTRISRMRSIVDELRKSNAQIGKGFVQCEVIPFHSSDLAKGLKLKLARSIAAEESAVSILCSYKNALSNFLRSQHVIALDASNSPESPWDDWVTFKSGLFGLEKGESTCCSVGTASTGGKHSTYVHRSTKLNGLIRAHYFRQGLNGFRDHPVELALRINELAGPAAQ